MRALMRRIGFMVVTLFVITWSGVSPAGAITGPNQTYFYNGDTCALGGTGPVCLYANGSMIYGTLSTGSSYPPPYRWRAGSGNGSKDRCAISAGPMPQGNWNFITHYDSKTGTISGRAWYLQDMLCNRFDPYSTKRTQMFIHTEETSTRGQYCPTSGDDPYCWEGAGDYYSLGCVKVNHFTDIPAWDSRWHLGTKSGPYLVVDA